MADFIQTSEYVEEVLKPNGLGQATTIADALPAVNEGVDISNISDKELGSYFSKEIMGDIQQKVRSNKKYKERTFGLYRDEQEFGAGFSIAMTKHRAVTQNTNIVTLESIYDNPNAPAYFDSHFYGIPFSNKIYVGDSGFKIPYSKSNEMLRKSFFDNSVREEINAEIDSNIINTVADSHTRLSKSILRTVAKNAFLNGRIVSMHELWNSTHGYTVGDDNYIATTNEAKAAFLGKPEFTIFVLEQMYRMPYQFLEFNTKYNDGSVETFCDSEDVRNIILEEADSKFRFTKGMVYNPEYIDVGENYKVQYWQNASTEMLPHLSSTSKHDQIVIDNGEGENPTVIDGVLGLCFDKFVGGVSTRISKITSDYIGSEDFTNFYFHVVNKYWVDDRLSSVIYIL